MRSLLALLGGVGSGYLQGAQQRQAREAQKQELEMRRQQILQQKILEDARMAQDAREFEHRQKMDQQAYELNQNQFGLKRDDELRGQTLDTIGSLTKQYPGGAPRGAMLSQMLLGGAKPSDIANYEWDKGDHPQTAFQRKRAILNLEINNPATRPGVRGLAGLAFGPTADDLDRSSRERIASQGYISREKVAAIQADARRAAASMRNISDAAKRKLEAQRWGAALGYSGPDLQHFIDSALHESELGDQSQIPIPQAPAVASQIGRNEATGSAALQNAATNSGRLGVSQGRLDLEERLFTHRASYFDAMAQNPELAGRREERMFGAEMFDRASSLRKAEIDRQRVIAESINRQISAIERRLGDISITDDEKSRLNAERDILKRDFDNAMSAIGRLDIPAPDPSAAWGLGRPPVLPLPSPSIARPVPGPVGRKSAPAPRPAPARRPSPAPTRKPSASPVGDDPVSRARAYLKNPPKNATPEHIKAMQQLIRLRGGG